MKPLARLTSSIHYFFILSLILLVSVTGPAVAAKENSSELPAAADTDLQMAPLNPDFVAYQATDTTMATSAGGTPIPAGLTPSPLDLSHLDEDAGDPASMEASASSYPATYDLRDQGRVTAVKDQGGAGSCWAFATLASLESYLLPGESTDYSENNMKNILSNSYFEGFDRAWDAGGNRDMSTAYLARWSGPVNEADDPYNPNSGKITTGLTVRKHVQDVYFLADRTSATDNDEIKQFIQDYGAVYVGIYWGDDYYNSATYGYYNPGYLADGGHAIALVGWDDTYSADSFNYNPGMDGAFIAKNSWGTGWGDAGYFYISYADPTISSLTMYTGEAVTNYDNIYQYDPLGWTTLAGYSDTTAWFANIFTADGEENLDAVSFYSGQYNSPYEVYIYKDPSSGPTDGTLVAYTSGTMTMPGYHTVDLPQSVSLSAGDRFSAVVKLTTPGWYYPIPVEYPIPDYSSKATASPGESYVSSDGSTWNDLTGSVSDGNVCVKAFTTDAGQELASIVVTPATALLTVGDTQQFTATGYDTSGDPMDIDPVWLVSNTTVGSINSNGVFTASAAGSTTISATNNSVVGTASVTVRSPVQPEDTYEFVTAWGTLGDGEFFYPEGIAVDGSGYVYVADTYNHRIQKFTAEGTFVTTWGSSGTGDGEFRRPEGIAVDGSGYVYVADTYNDRIQKFTADGTFVTTWGSSGTGDGEFTSPYGIAVDGSGNVYVADQYNDRIQKFTADGTFVTTWGSSGTGDGEFRYPEGIAVDGSGNVYVADQYNHRIQKFTADGTFVTTWGSYGTGDGEFRYPEGIAVDGSGNVYVADRWNDRIQKFTADGTFVTTWGGSSGTGDGEFRYPEGIAVDGSGNVYVADTWNDRIQKFTADGTFVTTWGSFGTGDGEFLYPIGIAVDGSGSVYVADRWNARIQKFTADGTFVTTWGSPGTGDGEFRCPEGIAVDGSGYVYVADTYNARIQKFTAEGTFVTKWGSSGTGDGEFRYPEGIAVDGSGYVYVADSWNHRIQKFTTDGTFVTTWGSPGTGDGEFLYPYGVAVDGSGYVYVADSWNDRIQKFTSDGEFVTTWGSSGTGNGEFYYPYGVAVDGSGYVYVADSWNYRIQVFRPTGGSTLHCITVTPSSATLSVGEQQQFTATGYDSGGTVMTITPTWTSSNTNVGSISQSGLFTAIAAGTTTVTAESEGVQGTAAVTVTAEPVVSGSVTRSISPSSPSPGDTVTVTLTPSSTLTTSPGWGVIETIPTGLSYVAGSSDADGTTDLGSNQYRFTRLGGNAMSYQISVPSSAAEGTYTLAGTWTDGEKTTGTVEGTTSITVSDLISRYTDPSTGKVEKDGAVQAVNDYLFNGIISKEDAITVVNAYLFG